MTHEVADARRSQLVSTYGVGSLFPAGDESFMICGLDDWPIDPWAVEISEPRLARSLGVMTFRPPPSGRRDGDVPVVRFPDYHFCTQCRALKRRQQFCNDRSSYCRTCGRRITPSRFVACCPRGHIEDFPFHQWVHAGSGAAGGEHNLTLSSQGRSSSLADIIIGCSCGVPSVSMDNSFRPTALKGIAKCHGRRPWLADADEDGCQETLRALQRGSSNVWFPEVRSAISIPPWSDRAHQLARRHWAVFKNANDATLREALADMDLARQGLSVEMMLEAVAQLRGDGTDDDPYTDERLRREEYQALTTGHPETSSRDQFVAVPVAINGELAIAPVLEQVSTVSRLREVRALASFSRITPWSPGTDEAYRGAITAGQPVWLPAMEVLGEGIFLRFDSGALADWEAAKFAHDRAQLVCDGMALHGNMFGRRADATVSPRELLLHSFAHVLLNELSLDAGYPAASLRERLYAGPDEAGVLIYTASADSAGSLGGLAAQSAAARFDAVVRSAIRRARWCTADPVCIEATSSGAGGVNLAACHACLLLPETSCERYNSVLDRATLVGVPEEPEAGFFSALS
ncbi:DrmB family protein [Dactylosporangium sp. NPDC051541]|uniref:DrmB family protein n=1 Tax=Dactylosporangium sp. NPDC051541 TaxID=3363977 RepID=UPI00379FD29A